MVPITESLSLYLLVRCAPVMLLAVTLSPFLSSSILPFFTTPTSRFCFLQCCLHCQAGQQKFQVYILLAQQHESFSLGLTGPPLVTYLFLSQSLWSKSCYEPVGQVRVMGSPWCYQEGRVSSI